MSISLDWIDYDEINYDQKEKYSYNKVSARLANFGYTNIRLHDDFEGDDFIAKHVKDDKLLKVKLKGRLTFDEKYMSRDSNDQIYIAFRAGKDWYVYPHDEVFDKVTSQLGIIKGAQAWGDGTYHIGSLSEEQKEILEPYLLQRSSTDYKAGSVGGTHTVSPT